jgi:hypothetical protein
VLALDSPAQGGDRTVGSPRGLDRIRLWMVASA